MNQRFDPNENRNANPAAWPADAARNPGAPLSATPLDDPLLNQRRAEDIAPRSSRSTWPVLIILLAGLVLALLVWLPAEMSSNAPTDTATPPAATSEPATPPAGTATPGTATQGTATPDAPAAGPAAPAPDTQAPASGSADQPQGNTMAPQGGATTAPAN